MLLDFSLSPAHSCLGNCISLSFFNFSNSRKSLPKISYQLDLAEFELTEKQAEAILDISLRRLTALEVCHEGSFANLMGALVVIELYWTFCFCIGNAEK